MDMLKNTIWFIEDANTTDFVKSMTVDFVLHYSKESGDLKITMTNVYSLHTCIGLNKIVIDHFNQVIIFGSGNLCL